MYNCIFWNKIENFNKLSAQNQAAPGVYDPLETVLYFKYCIAPYPLESQENAGSEIGKVKVTNPWLNESESCDEMNVTKWTPCNRGYK